MSTFDIRADAPGLLRAESINVSIKFERTSETTGRVSWNIPSPAAGCTAENQAYCGMLITIDTTPASASKSPTTGQAYDSDTNIDANLFAGDKIGTSMVIGAYYNDRTTTFFDVTGLKPNTPYYVSGFPVDCQLRYFIEGVHAYSQEFTNRGTDGSHGTQVVVLNSNATAMGVSPTDATGLSPFVQYDFSIQLGITPTPGRPVDSTECLPAPPNYNVVIDGTNAQTFQDLVTAINNQFATLANPAQGPAAPNTGAYYWNSSQQKLFQWNGETHVEVPVLIDNTVPDAVVIGSYWLNPTTNVLQQWDGAVWNVVTVITFGTDPKQPIADVTYWYDGTTVRIWNGNTWCVVTSYAQATDPSLPLVPAAGSYWYDTADGALYKWNATLEMWELTTAIQYHIDVNALPPGTYWFNETTNVLSAYNGSILGWMPLTNTVVSELEPTTPTAGLFWYNPIAQELVVRNPANTAWLVLDVVVFPSDPTVRTECGLWWNTATDILYVWDSITSTWVQVAHLYQQATDPTTAPVITNGSIWINGAGQTLVWDTNCFNVTTSVINWPTDPTLGFVDGVVWFDGVATWNVMTAGSWVTIDPIQSPNDPRNLPAGTFWFNTTNNGLQMWNGVSWVSVMYSTVPLTPTLGTLWFDTTTNTLKTWTSVGWAAATSLATVELDCNGNLLFTDTAVGSTSYIQVTDGTLFGSLAVQITFHTVTPGVDGASDVPSYMELGIGTDGNEAFRAAMANDIRYDLGYPVVDVELTKEQIDYAINVALAEFRSRSGMAYKRGFFFMQLKPEEQKYYITNKISGMNKIVDIMGVYRMTSSFLSSAHGAGVYGQIVLQHLYNMGTFDLLSYHIMGEYTKLMEMLFAARITYQWNEQTRELFINHRFPFQEKMVCIEATSERTEQDLMADRYVRSWIRRYAAAKCRLMLAEIRGKYASLPGAGGSVTLNAGELRQQGTTEIEACLADIDDYIVDGPDGYGMGSQFTFG